MNKVLVIAKKEFTAAFKDRVLLLMVILFLAMSIVSVYVGSTTKNAELKAYGDIVAAANAQGAEVPEAPLIFPLEILHNMTEYIVMIGAVLAIFLGFDAFSGEREGGTLRVIFARPISRFEFIAGKLLGAGFMIGALLLAAFIFNLLLFAVFTGLFPNTNEILRLILFMITAFLYMIGFYMFSFLASIHSRNRTFSFLVMMAAWTCISFVIPQLAETQRNFAFAVNNVAGTVTQIPDDTAISRLIDWFSPAVQFKHIGDDLLQVHSESALISAGTAFAKQIGQFLYILSMGVLPFCLSALTVKKEGVL
ncbi:ABC-2 type transport system permease protein [Lacrimispora sphenoides]|nr:ABC-2 type transport system permease protein [Lacrimispora sphenoides]